MKFLGTFISIFILISAIAAVVIIIGLKSLSAPGPLSEEKVLIIENGMGGGQIASKLDQENIISSPFLFKAAIKFMGTGTLKAGEYRFEQGIPMVEVLGKLETGDVIQRQITIPEGLTSHEIVRILNKTEKLEGNIEKIPPEGSILPETYSYSLGDTRQGKIEQMQKKMQETLDELWATRDHDLPIQTKEEAIILASIVEKETAVASERKRVAGVFVNRLNKNMPLQTDPTVIYAITKGDHKTGGQGPLGRRLLKKDLQIDSPYNTYKYPGLPPGPIANPGKDAIAAALNPEKNDYIFFVADGSGGHIFAKTLDEHNYNVANWRKIRAENEQKAKNKDVIEDEVNEPLFE